MIIVICGADGAGKTTVAKKLAEYIGADLIEFPSDDTVTGPMIRSYLRKGWHTAGVEEVEENGPLAFQALQIVNRLEMLPRIMGNDFKLKDLPHVVLARYWQSGVVYGALDGLDRKWLHVVQNVLPRADLNILLDVPVSVAMERRAARDGDLPPERYEGKAAFVAKVIEGYRELWAEANEEVDDKQWPVIDATQPIEGVLLDSFRAFRNIELHHRR